MRLKFRTAVGYALLLGACSGDVDTVTSPTPPDRSDRPAPENSVTVQAGANSNVFSPEEVTVARGSAVTWRFGERTHNVAFSAAQGAPANVPNTSDRSVSRTFDAVGNFSYECTLHSGMTGTVKVQ